MAGFFTAIEKLKQLRFQTSASFVKILKVCNCEFKTNFLSFWCLCHLRFALEAI